MLNLNSVIIDSLFVIIRIYLVLFQIPYNPDRLIEYRAHSFWLHKYCPSHEYDGTARCCSCERLEARGTGYVPLEDGRKLCLECLDSAIMDRSECQLLFHDIKEFYRGIGMEISQEFPLLLVERQALNEAINGERNVSSRIQSHLFILYFFSFGIELNVLDLSLM